MHCCFGRVLFGVPSRFPYQAPTSSTDTETIGSSTDAHVGSPTGATVLGWVTLPLLFAGDMMIAFGAINGEYSDISISQGVATSVNPACAVSEAYESEFLSELACAVRGLSFGES